MSLAERVARRYLRRIADSYGDPAELLQAYGRMIARYAAHEDTAKNWLRARQEIERLTLEGPHTKPERERLRETHMIEVTDKTERRTSFRDKAGPPTMEVAYNGRSGALGKLADRLCLAILQQLVLPPGLRRSVEASAKWWDKAVRRPRGKSYEEGQALELEQYLEHLEVFRKYEKIYEEAIRVGKPHMAEGEGATRMKAGPFVVVNTGGFSPDSMDVCVKLAEDAARLMEGIGLGKVCYGDMLMSNRLMNKQNVMAFYSPEQDEMFIRINATPGAVRFICHELTHRLVNKFLQSKKHEIAQLYATINTHSRFLSQTEMPPSGDKVEYKGKMMHVVNTDARRKSVSLGYAENTECFVCAEKGRAHHEDDEEHKAPIRRREVYQMPVAMFYKLKGVEQKVDPMDFITPYAKVGGPEENFCEMVSFYALGKLPKAQLDLLLPILG
jgi:hypothetical protein